MEYKTDPNISEKFIDQLYSMNVSFRDEHGNNMEIPDSGFLGLLAAGYKGVVMLRKKRGQIKLYQKFTKGKRVAKKNPRGQRKLGRRNMD